MQDGVVTVVGITGSDDFPVTPGAFDETHNGGSSDAFVARLDPSQKDPTDQLVWASYLGGSDDEMPADPEPIAQGGMGIVVQESGIVTVAGFTRSLGFPTTPGAYDTTHNGNWDVFVAHLDPIQVGPDQMLWSTFFGRNNTEALRFLDVNETTGIVTLMGGTFNTTFPTTSNAYDTTWNGGSIDGFISRFDPAIAGGGQLVYSSFIGCLGFGLADSAVLDGDMITIVGVAQDGFPTTPNAYDTTYNGDDGTFNGGDGYLARLDLSVPGPDAMRYATYLGGSANDGGRRVAVSGQDVIVCAYTDSANFPTTPGAYDTTHNGSRDYYVLRLDLCPIDVNDDGAIGVEDLVEVILAWGPCDAGVCAADINGDGIVDVVDLVEVIVNWAGECP